MNLLHAEISIHITGTLLIISSTLIITVNKEQQLTHAHTDLKEVPGKDSAIVDFTTQPCDKSRADGFAFLSFLNTRTHTLYPARHMIKKAF